MDNSEIVIKFESLKIIYFGHILFTPSYSVKPVLDRLILCLATSINLLLVCLSGGHKVN